METSQLAELIQQIHAGREEDGSLEWKRAFWLLNQDESRREFLKDIAAMANSTERPQVRRIVVGVARSGKVQPCTLPEDEADLQQRLRAITPQPTVRFESHDIDGTPLVVVEVHPPFDRPYVARVGDHNFVWVRQGSTTVTATRYHLDSFYRVQSPKPALSIAWIDKDEQETPVLELPTFSPFDAAAVQEALRQARPSEADLRLIDEQADVLRSAIDRYGSDTLKLGQGMERIKPELVTELPRELAKEVDSVLEALRSDPEEIAFRYDMEAKARRLLLRVRNEGTCPAEGVVVYLYGSTRLRVLEYLAMQEQALPIPSLFFDRAQALISLADRLKENPRALEHLNQPLLLAARIAPPFWEDQLLSHLPTFGSSAGASPADGGFPLHVGSLPHGHIFTLGDDDDQPTFVVGDLALGEESALHFAIYADNLPEPTRGVLRVRGIAAPSTVEEE